MRATASSGWMPPGRSEAIAIAYDHEAAAKQAEQADDWNGRTRRGPDL
ncbi:MULTISPECIES: hypothetical protein [unclassified Mesorhizobium]|nr:MULTISPECIES: hypothetical protein [unclassified Mesorhizobium]